MKHVTVQVFPDKKIGIWQGMGGAITEATAYNFKKLSPEKQRDFLYAYYGKDGLNYDWGRIAIGSNDFCLTPYECTVKKNMQDFSITADEQYILPLLKRILGHKDLTLVASPWSPPSFMKTNKELFGGKLKRNYYGAFARYIKKWLEAYKANGIEVSYITPQNEPMAAQKWESCTYSLAKQRILIYKYLIPELESFDTKILVWDHNKTNLQKVAEKLLKTKTENEKVAGVAFHWYDGIHEDEMKRVKRGFPNKIMVATEMCCGFSPYDEKVWRMDAKLYLKELFSDINCGASAWIDWNILLSWRGGPNYCNNFTKAPVILNENEDDFILTPIFEALKTFANLFPAGSEVVRCEYRSDDIVVIVRKSKSRYEAVIANISNKEQSIELKLKEKSKQIIVEESEIIRVGI